ncbi:MAG: alpha-2-macroglobulin family protein [Nitrospirae bacterium]|nr:alpha-2-macroglobulin family protein [Nitrospirota bacterium]
MLALAVGSAGGLYAWFRIRPRPVKLVATPAPPGPTRLEKGAVPDPLSIEFSDSAARLEQVGKEIKAGLLVSPPLKGKWVWETDRELKFNPEQEWGVGQEYSVRFDRNLFPTHVHPESYEIKFQSAPFEVALERAEFYQDPEHADLKKVVATVSFTHPVDPSEFEPRLVLRMEGQRQGVLGIGGESFPFKVTYDDFKGEAYIHSDPVRIALKDTHMTIHLAAGVRSLRGGPRFQKELESKVRIPGMYDFFKVESAELTIVRNEKYEPEQILVLATTDGVSDQDLRTTLHVCLLPRDLPSIQGRSAVKNYDWYDAGMIGPEVLDLCEPLGLDALPTEREHATLHSFKFKAEPGRHLYVKINKGLRSHGGYVLADTFDKVAGVPEFPKSLEIMHDGAILSMSGEKKISIVSNGIEAIRFEIARVLPHQINHLVSQTTGYQKEFHNPGFSWNFGPENITERFVEIREFARNDLRKAQYTALDLSVYLAGEAETRRGLFLLKAESWDQEKKETTGIKDNRLVLVTDLGLLVKEARDGARQVFLMSFADGGPVAGAKVEVIGKNGLPVVSGTTGSDGTTIFPSLKDFDREKTPTAYVATHAADLSFMPYDWADRRLNFSRFDVGGLETTEPGRLLAYLFSDRGIYRPGDEIRVGLIVKPPDWKQDLGGVPLETVITDPRGLVVQRKRIRLSPSGFEEILYRTEENGPTGGYQIGAYVVKDDRAASLLASVPVRVEEFLPDRMTIVSRFSDERREGWVSPDGLKVSVSLRNLIGTPATNRRVAASITLTPSYPSFRPYADFTFYDPNREKKAFTERLEEWHTDEEGRTEFDLHLERFDRAVYRMIFVAEAYESGAGRAVTSENVALVSDLPFLLGYKPDGDLKYVKRDAKRTLRIIAVDPKLAMAPVRGLRCSVIEQQYVSVLLRQRDGTYKYESVQKENPVKVETLALAAEGLEYALPTEKPGDFVLLVQDEKGAELLRAGFSVIGEANLSRSLERNAELQIKLSKTDYAPGDEIEMQITAPYNGAGLITVERERVYASKWFQSRSTNTVQRIRVPADLEGNGFVNVEFVRDTASPEIFMSPLSYGVIPFSVSLERRTAKVDLDIPALALPGDPYSIRYRSDRPGKIVVYAIDEGILQVAAYKTPNPLAKFFERRALEVRTAQTVDLILPEFRHLKSLFSPGGDEYALGSNLNPFKRKRQKPVAYWSGMVDTDSQWRELVYPMPDYFNGTVRVMAVAVFADAIGVAERKGLVRGPFVVDPNIPTFASPGDEFEASVVVHNNAEGSGPDAGIEVEAKASHHLELLGPTRQTLKIAEGREGVAAFRVRAKDVLGSGNLSFISSWKEQRSTATVDLSIRPPAPLVTTVAGGHIRGGQAEVTVSRRLYPDFRVLEVSASTLPLGLANGLLGYLQKFPYGCTEQLVSQAFPSIVLRQYPEFGYKPGEIETRMADTLRILRARQNAEGAFGFWAANSHVSPFQSVYAMHFLSEAREGGLSVPEDLLKRGLNYLRYLSGKDVDALSEARVRAYSLYVLTRNSEITTGTLDALRTWLDKNLPGKWEKDLTGVYLAAVYKLLRLDRQANALISPSRLGDPQEEDYDEYYDTLTRDAVYLYIVSKHFPEQLHAIGGDELLHIIDPIVGGRFNTTSSAYSILALHGYAGVTGRPKGNDVTVSEILTTGASQPLVLSGGSFPRSAYSEKAVKVRIKNSGDWILFYQVSQSGFDLAAPAQELKQKMEVFREFEIAKGSIPVVGSHVSVHLRMRALDGMNHSDVAVVDLLPGGFEVVMDPEEGEKGNVRIAASGSSWRPDHADVREDRVILFGAIGEKTREFVYQIRPVNKGKYAVPPPFAEAMYDRSVQARGLGGTIEVAGPVESAH